VTNEISLTDRVAPYAERVRVELEKAPAGLSVKELQTKLSAEGPISERLVRDGLERLQFLGALVITRKIEPHKRGMSPFTYALRPVAS
jgi:hypothetical protein